MKQSLELEVEDHCIVSRNICGDNMKTMMDCSAQTEVDDYDQLNKIFCSLTAESPTSHIFGQSTGNNDIGIDEQAEYDCNAPTEKCSHSDEDNQLIMTSNSDFDESPTSHSLRHSREDTEIGNDGTGEHNCSGPPQHCSDPDDDNQLSMICNSPIATETPTSHKIQIRSISMNLKNLTFMHSVEENWQLANLSELSPPSYQWVAFYLREADQ